MFSRLGASYLAHNRFRLPSLCGNVRNSWIAQRLPFSMSSYFSGRFARRAAEIKANVVKQTKTDFRLQYDGLPDQIPIRPHRDLLKVAGFLVLVGAGGCTIASIAEFRRIKQTIQRQSKTIRQKFADGSWNVEDDLASNLSSIWNRSFGSVELQPYSTSLSTSLTSIWERLSASKKLVYCLIGANIGVFLAWKVPQWRPFMYRYFTSGYATKSLCLPSLLCVFSHFSAFHIFTNMFVLQSFASPVIDLFLGPEQRSETKQQIFLATNVLDLVTLNFRFIKFLAFYVIGGVFSSLIALSYKSFARLPVRGLGASGAILALLAYSCMKMPDSRLSIIFLPWFTFSAENALIGIVLFDLIGLLGRFRMFDHAAHLGGTLFGIWYAKYGEHLYRAHLQPTIVTTYYKLTGDGLQPSTADKQPTDSRRRLPRRHSTRNDDE